MLLGIEQAQGPAETSSSNPDSQSAPAQSPKDSPQPAPAEASKSGVFVTLVPTEKPGDEIRGYKLLEQIGHGGFGVVYLAEQKEPVKRRVALKIIKLGMDTKQVVARFEAERQALALMDHPNISKILEAGATETGRPYFVMELVPGLKVTDHCDQNNLSTAERLDLFVQICRAVQHAHQKGIIHRDLKPSNILVTLQDGRPVAKIIDFGIAKATQQELTEQTVFTQFGHFVGTPAYMSPEQAKLSPSASADVDTRSDIYSLGVLLYELLTGKTPFDTRQMLAGGLDEMRRTIRETEPARPSTRLSTMGKRKLKTAAEHRQSEGPRLIHLLRGDLDWIVMKCLEKDRARRYETANGLARDIERHLSNEPVLASPPSRVYRFQKLARRNRVFVSAAGLVAMVLVLGVLASTLQAVRATRAEHEQSRSLQRAQTEAAKSKEVVRFLEDMLKGAGPSAARGRDATMLREILDKTSERVENDLKDQPEVQGDLNVRLAMTYRDLGDYQKAEPLLERAVEEYRASSGNGDCKLAVALGLLGWNQVRLLRLYNVAFARMNAEQGLALARKCGDKETLASCLYYMAGALSRYGQAGVREEEPFLREAVALQRELGNNPEKLATYIRHLASCLDDPSNESEQLYREALALFRQSLGEDHPMVAGGLYGLAQCLLNENKLEEAKVRAYEALELGRKTLSKDHVNGQYYLDFLIMVLVCRGEWDEAERVLRAAVDEAPSLPDRWGLFAKLEARRRNWAAAVDYSAHEVAIDPSRCGTLPVMLLQAGRVDDYRKYCHSILERVGTHHWLEQVSTATNPVPAEGAAKVSLLLPVDGSDFDRACELMDLVAKATEPDGILHWFALWKGLADYRRGRFESARESSTRARSSGMAEPWCKVPALFIEAMAYAGSGNSESAKATLSAAEELMEKSYQGCQSFGAEADWALSDLLRREAHGLIDANLKGNEKQK
ncbi:MAG TPA: protein kinase [Verrucomicrobiae bacterium]|nr:protein kinase [Verrucomicrobiae bacterium]